MGRKKLNSILIRQEVVLQPGPGFLHLKKARNAFPIRLIRLLGKWGVVSDIRQELCFFVYLGGWLVGHFSE